MKQNKFLVTNKFGDFPEDTLNTIILIWDNWNDFDYYTLFGIKYVDSMGDLSDIGAIRIAYLGQMKGSIEKKLKIGDTFDKLDSEYFSLGTDDSYYENLNSLQVNEFVLKGLNDIAFNTQLLNRVKDEEVTQNSLLRDISYSTVINQYNRIANGGARLSNYSFKYSMPNSEQNEIEFNVFADQVPPTNIQIIIGSNGVGKSHLLNNMIDSVLNKNNDKEFGQFVFNNQNASDTFSNLVCVTFSAFDEYGFHQKNENPEIKYHYIGLKNTKSKVDNSLNDFAVDFTSSIGLILSSQKFARWKKVVRELESDAIFKSENFVEHIEKSIGRVNKNELKQKFAKLSSGHKIILLTITKLVELLQEKSLIFFDEPETHLHPPLLSSFIRAISKLLINRNAVCIMTTHSPIVLQEVPNSCVYKLSRIGGFSKFERPELETFGENIGVLTNEIFGLEVTESGFYKLLKEIVNENDTYENALNSIHSELGIEGKSILRSLFFDKKNI